MFHRPQKAGFVHMKLPTSIFMSCNIPFSSNIPSIIILVYRAGRSVGETDTLMSMVFPKGSHLDNSPLHMVSCNDTCSFTWTGAEHITQVWFDIPCVYFVRYVYWRKRSTMALRFWLSTSTLICLRLSDKKPRDSAAGSWI